MPAHCGPSCCGLAPRNVDVLAFAGLFLTEEHSGWLPALAEKAASRHPDTAAAGRPARAQPAARAREHSISGGVAGRVGAVLGYYRQMPEAVELRLHDTPLYNSVYRFDDEMLVNVHAYGILAAYTPVMHLRRVDGAFFNTYIESFERVWASARAPDAGDLAGMPLSKTRGGKPKARTDYWDDPGAPSPTSRKPSASVVLRNHAGELLLLRRADTGRWTIPTGGLKKKETMTACAIRECREETGLAVELTGLVGVFSDPRLPASPSQTARSGCRSTCASTASRSAASCAPTPNPPRPPGSGRKTWTATTSTRPSCAGSATPCTALVLTSTELPPGIPVCRRPRRPATGGGVVLRSESPRSASWA